MENQNKLRPRYDPAKNRPEKLIFGRQRNILFKHNNNSLPVIAKAGLSVPFRAFLLRSVVLLLLWSRLA